MPSTIVISRKWNSPKITVAHDEAGIRIELSRDDFAKAFSVALALLTFWQRLRAKADTYESAAQLAFDAVVEEAKMATIHHPMAPR